MDTTFTKETIYIDIDGTYADSIPWWLTLYNYNSFTSFQKVDLTSYDPMNCLGISLEKYYDDYRGVKTVDGAMMAYIRLNVRYNVVFVTAGKGEYWLRNQGINNEVIRISGSSRKFLRGFALIDDCEDNLVGFEGEKFLMKQPWTMNSANYVPTTWPEITEVLLERVNTTGGIPATTG